MALENDCMRKIILLLGFYCLKMSCKRILDITNYLFNSMSSDVPSTSLNEYCVLSYPSLLFSIPASEPYILALKYRINGGLNEWRGLEKSREFDNWGAGTIGGWVIQHLAMLSSTLPSMQLK